MWLAIVMTENSKTQMISPKCRVQPWSLFSYLLLQVHLFQILPSEGEEGGKEAATLILRLFHYYSLISSAVSHPPLVL